MELNSPLFAFTWWKANTNYLQLCDCSSYTYWVEFKNVELFHIWAVLKQFMKLHFIYMAPNYNSYLKVLYIEKYRPYSNTEKTPATPLWASIWRQWAGKLPFNRLKAQGGAAICHQCLMMTGERQDRSSVDTLSYNVIKFNFKKNYSVTLTYIREVYFFFYILV